MTEEDEDMLYEIEVGFSDIGGTSHQDAGEHFITLMREYMGGGLGGLYVHVTDQDGHEEMILVDPTVNKLLDEDPQDLVR